MAANANGIRLTVVQQPQRARVCGFSIHDRRSVQPPPIIQITGVELDGTTPLVMFVTLWSRDLQNNLSYSHKSAPPFAYTPIQPAAEPAVQNNNPTAPQQRYNVEITEGYIQAQLLIGSLVCEAMDLTDANNKRGLFFCFADLAVRCSGFFRLRFEAYHLGRQGPPIAWAVSDVFQTFSPKTFPGNVEPTALSRTFLRQGVAIRMRDSAGEPATMPKRVALKKKGGTKEEAVCSAAQHLSK
ncbi:hypothetical protein HDU81_004907 [Chytriomyces hyalinus]|nr:hypothetical protein HDU81_004907 [Chytriomyces hyalinus]